MAKGLVAVLLGGLGIVLVVGLMYVSYNNQETRLRFQVIGQQKKNEAVFDNTWKIIQQQAGVSDQYKDAFKQIYPALMEGRYGGGAEKGGQQPLMKFVHESNPNFEIRLYDRLMTSIEAQRTIFTREQTQLIDLKREHDTLLTVMPASFFLGGKQPIDIKIVTSTRTEQTFATGKDDNVDLFKK